MSSITRSSDPKLIPDECPVCLEPILQSDLIGTVKNCSHYYHENCITTWSQHSNSCPSCRRLYYLVEIAVMGKPTHVTKRITVKDKLPVNDAIDNIPSEYVQPGGGVITDLAGSVSEASSSSSSASASAASAAAAGSVCTICTSSQYRPSWRMLSCTSCLSSFHVRCLGISNSVDIWYCPICDSAQENKMPPSRAGTSVMSSIRQSRRSTPSMNSRITEAVFRNPAASSLYIGSSETLAVLPLSGDGRIAGTGPRRPPTGLVIFNTNHELDDNFSDEEERNPVPTSPPLNVVNGGVLLRRELKEKENLSKEESISWDVFDTAKSLQQSSTGTSAVSVSSSTGPATSAGSNHGVGTALAVPPARRRRRKITKPLELEAGSSNSIGHSSSVPASSSSRISTLMKQIKSTKYSPASYSSTMITTSTSSDGSPSLSPITVDSDSYPSEEDLATKRPCTKQLSPPLPPPNTMSNTLSLEQKNEIQKYLRNHLRPLYKPNTTSNDSLVIRSEDDYISINKSLSRQIYHHIQSLPNQDDLFINLKQLQDLVDNIFQANRDSLFKSG